MTQHVTESPAADEVKSARALLVQSGGWGEANALKELVSPDGVVWLVTSYVHGEFTMAASYRPRGYGTAEGIVRVRITPTMAANHPGIGIELAQELLDWHSTFQSFSDIEQVPTWPTPAWREYSR